MWIHNDGDDGDEGDDGHAGVDGYAGDADGDHDAQGDHDEDDDGDHHAEFAPKYLWTLQTRTGPAEACQGKLWPGELQHNL